MKKINQLYFFLFTLVGMSIAFTSCQEEDLSYESGDAFHFRTLEISVDEDTSTPVAIPLVFTKTTALAGSVTIAVTSDDAVENTDYVVLSATTFEFAGDQYFDTLYIQPLPNTVRTEDKVINIVMTSGTASLGYPGLEGGTSFDSTRLVLLDNECDVPDSNLAGSYTVTTTYGFHDFLSDYPTNTMDMTIVNNDNGTYSAEDFSGGLYGTGPYVGAYNTLPISDVQFTAEISGDVSWSGASDPWGPLVMTPGGVNSVDQCGIITISWTAEQYGENGVSVYTPL